MPSAGVLVEHDDKGIFMRNRVGHKLLICRAVIGQLLFWIRAAAEDIKPAQHVIIIRVGACTGIRIVTPYITKLVITTADIDGDAGIVKRFHYFYPYSELSFEFACACCTVAGDEVAGENNKVDLPACNLGNKLTENKRIDSIDGATAVTGDDEFPGLL